MSDQCKFCTCRGDIEDCIKTDCTQHENWYAQYLNKRIVALEKFNSDLLVYIEKLEVMVKDAN